MSQAPAGASVVHSRRARGARRCGLLGGRDRTRLEEAAGRVEATRHGGAEIFRDDLTVASELADVTAAIRSRPDGIDVLVHSAGEFPRGRFRGHGRRRARSARRAERTVGVPTHAGARADAQATSGASGVHQLERQRRHALARRAYALTAACPPGADRHLPSRAERVRRAGARCLSGPDRDADAGQRSTASRDSRTSPRACCSRPTSPT